MQYEIIEEGVKRRDVPSLRKAIGGICYTSRDFSSGEFDEAIQYVEARNIKLKDDTLIGEPTISSQKKESDLTDEDFAVAVFELKQNFCDERIADVKKIGKVLYSEKGSGENYKPKGKEGPNVRRHQQKEIRMLVAGLAVVALLIILACFVH